MFARSTGASDSSGTCLQVCCERRCEQAQQLTAEQIGDVLQIREETVEVVNTTLAGSARPGEKDTVNAVVTAGAVRAGEAWHPGIAKHSTTAKPELAETSGEAVPFWSRANGMNSAAPTAVAMSAGGARPPRFVKYSVTSTSEPELAASKL